MFGLAQFVIRAEREWLRDKAVETYEGLPREPQVWLWHREALFPVAGVLALFIVGGRGV